jgi:hypothetical protein
MIYNLGLNAKGIVCIYVKYMLKLTLCPFMNKILNTKINLLYCEHNKDRSCQTELYVIILQLTCHLITTDPP